MSNTQITLARKVAELRVELLNQQLNDMIDEYKEDQRRYHPSKRTAWDKNYQFMQELEATKQKGFAQIQKTAAGVSFQVRNPDKPKQTDKVCIHPAFHQTYNKCLVADVYVDRNAWIVKIFRPGGGFLEIRVTKSMTSKATLYNQYIHGRRKPPHRRDEFGEIIR